MGMYTVVMETVGGHYNFTHKPVLFELNAKATKRFNIC